MTESEKVTRPTSPSEVENIVRQMIVSTLMLEHVAPESLNSDEPDFIVRLGANSIDTLELIISVEERFGFEFDDDEINRDLLCTLKHFVNQIWKKLNAPAAAAAATPPRGLVSN